LNKSEHSLKVSKPFRKIYLIKIILIKTIILIKFICKDFSLWIFKTGIFDAAVTIKIK